mmetsp:Transcript_69179/g.129114  ORF Transcript_69179/g.129114 Transcript_69179/m.129114 type:complete len:103 (-) Transcript_69179:64-372(-)
MHSAHTACETTKWMTVIAKGKLNGRHPYPVAHTAVCKKIHFVSVPMEILRRNQRPTATYIWIVPMPLLPLEVVTTRIPSVRALLCEPLHSRLSSKVVPDGSF